MIFTRTSLSKYFALFVVLSFSISNVVAGENTSWWNSMKESMGTVYGDLSDNTKSASPAQKNKTNTANRNNANTSGSTVSVNPANPDVRELIK